MTHQIILIDTLSVNAMHVIRALRTIMGYSSELAWKIVDDVEDEPSACVPCFNGSLQECQFKAHKLELVNIPCQVKPIGE